MRILNYRGHSFAVIEEENFYVSYYNFIDYNWDTREVCITMQNIGRRSIFVANYSWLTTEYTGSLTEVMDQVIDYQKNNELERKN